MYFIVNNYHDASLINIINDKYTHNMHSLFIAPYKWIRTNNNNNNNNNIAFLKKNGWRSDQKKMVFRKELRS